MHEQKILVSLVLTCCSIFSASAFARVSEPVDSRTSDCVSQQKFRIGDSLIRVQIRPNNYSLDLPSICAWVVNSATTVSGYFGRFPVSDLQLVLKAVPGRGVQGGTTYGNGSAGGGPLVTVQLGRTATAADLQGDWIMIHEMVHLAVPSVPRRSHWLEEGIATYVEPIARARRGQLSADSIWTDMRRGMPKGLPRTGDRGLDRTPTWGRTYWGGAMFCLLADVEIRHRTNNRFSLDDALRGILDAGGNITRDWSVNDVLKAGDRATGTQVLTELYEKMAYEAGADELDSLWQRLGIISTLRGIRFDDKAPDAHIRDAITAEVNERVTRNKRRER